MNIPSFRIVRHPSQLVTLPSGKRIDLQSNNPLREVLSGIHAIPVHVGSKSQKPLPFAKQASSESHSSLAPAGASSRSEHNSQMAS